MMVSQSGKTGLLSLFSMGHLGFRGSEPLTLQLFKSNLVSGIHIHKECIGMSEMNNSNIIYQKNKLKYLGSN